MKFGPDKYRLVINNIPEQTITEILEYLNAEQVVNRIWERDYTLWKNEPTEINNRLGWLDSYKRMAGALPEIDIFVEQIRNEGFNQALLLGMGGSSLAPGVFRKIFGVRSGYIDLNILDSTDPEAIADKEEKINLQKTLFIVSTKSGGTIETLSLMNYFYNRVLQSLGANNAGRHFIAITDPGSGLEKTAKKLHFRKIFLNDPDIGGRYSALSYFGLVPASLIGMDIVTLLQNVEEFSNHARLNNNQIINVNTAALLGAVLGLLGKNGHDKVTFIFSPDIQPFGMWLEQLLAESTGKEGKGLLPVDGEKLKNSNCYANDRLFVCIRLDHDFTYAKEVKGLIESGQPVIQLNLQNSYCLGREMFRWMIATAVAGWSLRINPFDQPDVESAKILAHEMVTKYRETGKLYVMEPDMRLDNIEVYFGAQKFTAGDLKDIWRGFFQNINPGTDIHKGRSYVAIQAYLKPEPNIESALQRLRNKISTLYQIAVTTDYGPRYLHSTGQLHKGDAGKGLFIQLTSKSPNDIPIPDRPGSDQHSISFGLLKIAQAIGDRQALLNANRNVIRFHLSEDLPAAIDKLTETLQ
ncbi:MAG: glucose-6-phosphate isomerase [Bacillota bacterium]|nr:glucose-6-phosphate isomerase [Bacillota bacterium]